MQLISVKTIDGDTLYLKFRNILTGAFLEPWEDNYLTVGDIVLSTCVNNSLVFAINYGSPYLKGCLVTGWNENDNKPESFCFAERNTPEAVWFGQKNILIIIRNQMDVGSWHGKYIIYDNSKKSGERASSSDVLPSKHGYKIFQVK
ncbi:hypothetical protein QQF54_00215 [Lelliottia sp. V106_10]|nr:MULTISPECIES: hypothetical protein [unclassified Lelliottia]MDK9355126.1 hypothetical protein [Lelliottia sp. V106_16]MDK9371792.1 hypothetical protein [Lelliottia sp. V106_10]MDK9598971.1 hypothetical protein [Lelliottia sp. V106_5]